ncbi:hypothetical protein DDP57_00300 [Helicobacter pylori]|nr:hypothetical protein DDP57_00300 [Helicobacter pylori]
MQNLFISLRKSFLQQISSNQISFFRKNPFYNKIYNKSKEKILFINKPKTTKVKNPFLIATPIQTTSFLLK